MNNIGASGAAALAAAAKGYKTLLTVDLEANEIHAAGVASLATAMVENKMVGLYHDYCALCPLPS